MRLVILFFACLMLSSTSSGKELSESEILTENSALMLKALRKGDAEYVLDKMFPAAIELAGGRSVLASILEGSKSALDDADISFGAPSSLIKSDGYYLSFVPYHMTARSQTSRMEADSFMVAVRANPSEEWKFFDGMIIGKDFSKFLTMFPNFPSTYEFPKQESTIRRDNSFFLEKGLEAFSQKDYKKAIQYLQSAINLEETDRAYYELGLAYLQEYLESDKWFSQAEAAMNFTLAISLNRRHANAYYYRGYMRYIDDKFIEALADYDRALDLDPNIEDIYGYESAINKGEDTDSH